MSYPYYRHTTSTSTSRCTSSTSTSPPPTAPTIRVTSPVPDDVNAIDIWDPEVPEQVPQSYTKTYSFRYREEQKLVGDAKESPKEDSERGEFLPGGCFQRRRLSEDDGLATGESDDSSDVDDCSQVTTVTPGAADDPQENPGSNPELLHADSDDEIPKVPCSTPVTEKDSINSTANQSESLETVKLLANEKEEQENRFDEIISEEESQLETQRRSLMKRVQFSRSFSCARENGGATNRASMGAAASKLNKIQSRRYSSFEVQSTVDTWSLETFLPRTLLSPTPEVLHESSSPAVEQVESPLVPHQKCDAANSEATNDKQDTLDAPRIEIHQAFQDLEEGLEYDLLARLASLKQDTHLVEIASSFVAKVIAKAQEEARHRSTSYRADQKAKLSLDLQGIVKPKINKRNPWYRRLRMILLRTLTCTCVPTTPGNLQSPFSY